MAAAGTSRLPQVCNYLMLTSISGHVMLTLLPIFTVTFVKEGANKFLI
ncbi:Uncharacterised protein [Escherichia coli]|nr:Uncharacterised protein [Escherichia coli]